MYTPSSARIRACRFGFASLFVSAGGGFLLEAAHAFKLSAYLDEPVRRSLFTLAHAHGVGLALVVLAYAAVGIVDGTSAREGALLQLGSVFVPLGFALGALNPHESDPGVGIVLVPLGAALVLWSLFVIARAAFRQEG